MCPGPSYPWGQASFVGASVVVAARMSCRRPRSQPLGPMLVDEAKHTPAALDASGVRGASTHMIFCASVICIATAVVAELIANPIPPEAARD